MTDQAELIMLPVRSSHITHRGYDDDTKTLFITFAGGVDWMYENVPLETWFAFLEAPSAGKYFAQNIRKQFDGFKIPKPTDEPINVLAAG
jgi:KTSC domain